ncbi:hypothetical protein BDEG_26421 [Batrachochytrium dendrobatidis JEL423]|uniref:EKC/KEOPS complex subunit CGI121 n=1 Tax=Batrachochytrium dendrobatidis (strain JEL423) TaxID=403673 RepID=A0A177WSC1_BATDL|nr:hypothetical protein BDEG_26421 [Batrachochytrium dendrobatidis JEL423]
MRTHSDQSEILLSLSGDTSISQAFKQFGISKHTCNVLVVDYSGNDQIENHNQEILQDLTRHIHGTHIAEFTDLDNIRDMKAIRKIYSHSHCGRRLARNRIVDCRNNGTTRKH